jgi:hypothetical protein
MDTTFKVRDSYKVDINKYVQVDFKNIGHFD